MRQIINKEVHLKFKVFSIFTLTILGFFLLFITPTTINPIQSVKADHTAKITIDDGFDRILNVSQKGIQINITVNNTGLSSNIKYVNISIPFGFNVTGWNTTIVGFSTNWTDDPDVDNNPIATEGGSGGTVVNGGNWLNLTVTSGDEIFTDKEEIFTLTINVTDIIDISNWTVETEDINRYKQSNVVYIATIKPGEDIAIDIRDYDNNSINISKCKIILPKSGDLLDTRSDQFPDNISVNDIEDSTPNASWGGLIIFKNVTSNIDNNESYWVEVIPEGLYSRTKYKGIFNSSNLNSLIIKCDYIQTFNDPTYINSTKYFSNGTSALYKVFINVTSSKNIFVNNSGSIAYDINGSEGNSSYYLDRNSSSRFYLDDNGTVNNITVQSPLLLDPGNWTNSNFADGDLVRIEEDIDGDGSISYTYIIMDSSAPTTNISIENAKYRANIFDEWNVTSSTIFALSADDNGSGVNITKYKIDSDSWVQYTVGFDLSGKGEGSHIIKYYSKDNTSNKEINKTIIVWVDDSAPTTTLIINEEVHPNAGGSGCNITSITTLNLSAFDSPAHNSGINHIKYRFWNSSVGWTAWMNHIGNFTLGSDEGIYYLEFNATDNLNNSETTQNVTIWIDDSAPTTNLAISLPHHPSTPNDGCNVTSSTPLTLSSIDNPTHNSGVAFSWYTDNGIYYVYTGQFTLIGEGQHNITWGSKDNLNNNETGNNITVWVDDSAPDTPNIIVGDPKYKTNNPDKWNVTSSTQFTIPLATDYPLIHNSGLNVTKYKIDNDPWVLYTNPFTLSGKSEGSHIIYYNSTDYLGNNENMKNITVWVDDSPPITPDIVVGDPKYRIRGLDDYNITSSTLFTILTATDYPLPNNASVNFTKYKIDSDSWITYTTPFNLLGKSEGSHIIYYNSIDYLNNIENPKSLKIWIDDSPPITPNIIIGDPKYRANTLSDYNVTSTSPFTIPSATDNPIHNAGVNITKYKIDSGNWITYTTSFNLLGQPEGSHIIYYNSTDYLGNKENTKNITVWIDDSVPTTPNITVGDPKYRDSGTDFWNITSSTLFTIPSATDNPIHNAGINVTKYKIDNDPWVNYTSSLNLSGKSEGIHGVYYRSIDNLNNAEIMKFIWVRIDDSAPIISSPIIIEYSEYLHSNGTILYYNNLMGATPQTFMIGGNSEDNRSGLNCTTFSNAFGDSPSPDYSPSIWNVSYDVVFADSGNGIIYVNISDKLNNTSTLRFYYYEDLSAPFANTPIDEGVWSNSTSINWNWAASIDSLGGVAGYYICIGTTPGGSDVISDTWIINTSYTYSTAVHGKTYYAKIKAKDNVGNLGVYSGNSDGITVDILAPNSLSILVNNDAIYSNSLLVTLNLSASDSNSGLYQMQFSNDGNIWSNWENFFTSKSSWDLSQYGGTSSDGTKTVYFKVKDTAGNIASVVIDTIYLDRTNPSELSISIKNGDTYTNSLTVTLILSAADYGSGLYHMQFSNNGNIWSNWESFSNSKSNWDLSKYGGNSSDGTKSVYFRVKDNGGNIANYVNDTIILDRTLPNVSIEINGGAIYTKSSTVTLTITAIDGTGSGIYQMSFDSGGGWSNWETYTSSKQHSLPLGDGKKLVYVKIKDNAGNINNTEFDSIILDTIAPNSLYISINNGSLYTNLLSVTLSLSASDSNSGLYLMQFSNDGNNWSSWEKFSTSKTSWNLNKFGGTLSDGSKTVYFRVKDTVGNIASVITDSIYLDTISPSTIIKISLPKYITNLTYVTSTTLFSLSSNDIDSGVLNSWYIIDGDYYEGTSFDLSFYSSGEHVITYGSPDNVGNNESGTTISVIVDDEAPITPKPILDFSYSSGGIDYIKSSTHINVPKVSDNDSGVVYTEYKINDGAWTIYENFFTLSNEGFNNIYYRSIDNLGNIEKIQMKEVCVDNTPPITQISISNPKYILGDTIYLNSITQLYLSSTDIDGCGIESYWYKIDLNPWLSGSNFTVTGEGSHIIYYRAQDNLNNSEIENSITVIIDDSAPKTSINVGDPKYINSVNLYISLNTLLTLSSKDEASGIAFIQYKIDNGDWKDYEPFKIPMSGNHTIHYRSTDKIGNLEKTNKLVVTVDNNPPNTSNIIIGHPKHFDTITYVSYQTKFTISDVLDDYSGIAFTEYNIDGIEWITYTGEFIIGNEGYHTIYYRSIDKLNNIENIHVKKIFVDNSPPYTNIDIENPKYISNTDTYINSNTIFNLIPNDEYGSGINETWYQINNDYYIGTKFDLSAYKDGWYTITYGSKDKVGNARTEKVIQIYLDRTAPTIYLDIGSPKYQSSEGIIYISSSTELLLYSIDNGSGIKSILYSLDNGNTWRQYYASFTILDRINEIKYYCIDHVGNRNTEKKLSINIDNEPPDIRITTINENSYKPGIELKKMITTIGGIVDESGSGIDQTSWEYRYNTDGDLDSEDWLPLDVTIEGNNWIAYLKLNENTIIEVKCSDNLDYENTFKTRSLKYEKTSNKQQLDLPSTFLFSYIIILMLVSSIIFSILKKHNEKKGDI